MKNMMFLRDKMTFSVMCFALPGTFVKSSGRICEREMPGHLGIFLLLECTLHNFAYANLLSSFELKR